MVMLLERMPDYLPKHAARPADPQPGDLWMQPIEEIFGWPSTDGALPDADCCCTDELGVAWGCCAIWEHLLTEKRMDYQYGAVVEALTSEGFTRPVTCWKSEKEGYWLEFGDGHHRLAAAIDLGMTHIPMLMADGWSNGISADSGEWGW